jgi:hypothetical protein
VLDSVRFAELGLAPVPDYHQSLPEVVAELGRTYW